MKDTIIFVQDSSRHFFQLSEEEAISYLTRIEEDHIVPDYENVLKKGFTGLLQEVKELMDQLDMAIPSDLSKMTFYRACKIVLEGCLNYVTRCRDMIREKLSICSDRQRISELEKMEKRCSALLEHAPETFAEALQFIWFIHVMP